MADLLTLIVLVAAGEAADPAARAMAAATRDAMGNEARVVIREAASEPSDAEAIAAEASDEADVVVELRWGDARHRLAAIRMHIAPTGRWIDRQIEFRASDAEAERGRTLGFAVASIVPEAEALGPRAARASPSEATDTVPEPSPGPETRRPTPSAAPSPALPPNVAPKPSRADGASPAISISTLASEPRGVALPSGLRAASALPVASIAIMAIGAAGGNAGGLGGAAAIDWFLGPYLAVQTSAGARGGSVNAAAGGTLVVAFASAGLAVHPWRASATHPVGLSLRADAGCAYEAFTVADETQSAWRPALWATADVNLFISGDVEAFAGAGAEDIFSSASVSIDRMPRATIDSARVVAEAGLRLGIR